MKQKHSPGATKHKFGARTRKYKHGARPGNINLGPTMTATARARDCEIQIPCIINWNMPAV